MPATMNVQGGPPLASSLTDRVESLTRRGCLSSDAIRQLFPDENLPISQGLHQLLPFAARFAAPTTSRFHVGAVALGASGTVYFGANLEIPGSPLSFTVHAEQAAIVNALVAGESAISMLLVSSWPCGQCRQFMMELAGASDVEICVGDSQLKLAALLPHPFGPTDLGVKNGLLAHSRPPQASHAAPGDRLAAATAALHMSYAPYTKALAGLALETRAGAVVAAPYVESVAFNPSVQPALAALVLARLWGIDLATIAAATLVELDNSVISHETVSRSAILAFQPTATIDRHVIAADESRAARVA